MRRQMQGRSGKPNWPTNYAQTGMTKLSLGLIRRFRRVTKPLWESSSLRLIDWTQRLPRSCASPLGMQASLGCSPKSERKATARSSRRLRFYRPSMVAIHGLPIDEMRKIAAIRNFLAHAHFDQNPFDGTYELIPPKSDKRPSERHLKEAAIRRW